MAPGTSSLRWGLLGTAHINTRLIPAMRAARRSVVEAIASRDAERAASYAREWEIPIAHGSYDALLHDSRIDAVYIPLPNSLHVEWTLRALDAGKHVLCEKPMALSGADIERVAAVARARERVAAEAFMYRHEPLFARVLEVLQDDIVGRLRTISSGFTFVQTRHHDVRLDPTLGGGSLWDIGCYPVSAALAIARQSPVEAFGWAQHSHTGVDDAFTGLLRFSDHLVAIVQSGFRSSYRTWLEVAGTDGVLKVANPFKPNPHESIVVQRGDLTETIDVMGSPALFVRQVDDFVSAALDGQTPTVSLADSRATASALSALYRSVEVRQPVQL